MQGHLAMPPTAANMVASEPIADRLAAACGAAASPTGELSPLAWLQQQALSPEERTRVWPTRWASPFTRTWRNGLPRPTSLSRVPIAFARQHCVLGLSGQQGRLAVAISDVRSWPQLDVIARYLGRRVDPVLAPGQAILAAINAAYQQQTGQAQQLLESLDQKEVLAEIESLADREDLLDVAGRAPVIKLVNLIMFEAVKTRASDIHIQPYEDRVVVRLRIDGVLFDAFDVPKGIQEEILSRVKVIGRMNIAEKRLPQDGRATVKMGDRLVDLRIASLPTSYGERIVLRLLDKSAGCTASASWAWSRWTWPPSGA